MKEAEIGGGEQDAVEDEEDDEDEEEKEEDIFRSLGKRFAVLGHIGHALEANRWLAGPSKGGLHPAGRLLDVSWAPLGSLGATVAVRAVVAAAASMEGREPATVRRHMLHSNAVIVARGSAARIARRRAKVSGFRSSWASVPN